MYIENAVDVEPLNFKASKNCNFTSSHGIWNVTYKEENKIFVELKALDYSIQSWQCADKNLCTTGLEDCNCSNLDWKDTHSYEKGDDLYFGILLIVSSNCGGKSSLVRKKYRIWCKKTNGKSKARSNWQSQS